MASAPDVQRQAFLDWRERGTSERAELGGNYGGAVGINHLVLGVRDMDASHDFYVEVGWPVEFRMEHGMSHSIYVKNPDGFITEAMFEFPREYWIDNIEAALQYRRIITPEESDYLDPAEGDYPRFTADGIANRSPDGRKLS